MNFLDGFVAYFVFGSITFALNRIANAALFCNNVAALVAAALGYFNYFETNFIDRKIVV